MPARLFTLLKEHLSISKGAMLLYKPESGMYLLWASTGYDKTTVHRLRFPSQLITDLGISSDKPVFFPDKNENEQFKQFFSIREFSVTSRLVLVPLHHNQHVLGLLVMTDAGMLTLQDEDITHIFTGISTAAGKLLYSSRQQRMEKLHSNAEEQSPDLYKRLSEMIGDARETSKHVRIIRIDLSNLETMLKQVLQDADSFRINQDIYTVISSMIPEQGNVFHVNYSKLIIFLPGRTLIDPKLLIHQITSGLKRFFHVNNDFPELQSIVRSYPEDGEDETQLLKGLL